MENAKHYKYLVVDTETTGLHPESRIWEIAAAVLNIDTLEEESRFHQFVTLEDKDISNTDLTGDYLTNMQSRYLHLKSDTLNLFLDWHTNNFISHTAVFVGSNPHFDLTQLNKYILPPSTKVQDYLDGKVSDESLSIKEKVSLRMQDFMKAIYYKPIDVTTLLSSGLNISILARTDQIAKECNLDLQHFERHTAIGDVELNIELLRKYKQILR